MMLKSSLYSLLPLLLLAPLMPEAGKAETYECAVPAHQVFSKPTCEWPKAVSQQCEMIKNSSIFYQCNVYSLSINKPEERNDDNGNLYLAATFKYSEKNECMTGENKAISIFGKCDAFAAYAQILRHADNGTCYALVNSALLGTQLLEDSLRNSPKKVVQKLEIPGVSRRIIFTPSEDKLILSQPGAEFIKTESKPKYIASGPSISPLYLLELENTLTIKPDNLKPNPAKLRITRGLGNSTDFLDIPLSKSNETALNTILSGCR